MIKTGRILPPSLQNIHAERLTLGCVKTISSLPEIISSLLKTISTILKMVFTQFLARFMPL